jgi:hypothetical protein
LTFNPEVGRLNGGAGVVLLGQADGSLRPLWPRESGVIVPYQARHVQAVELDGDGRVDLVFGVQGPLTLFHNVSPRREPAEPP